MQLTKLQVQDIPEETVEDLKIYTPEELNKKDIQGVQSQLHVAEEELKATKPNLNTINVSFKSIRK